MTPTLLLTVLLLTYLAVTIVDWVLTLTANARVTLTLILLVLFSVWVFGLQLFVR